MHTREGSRFQARPGLGSLSLEDPTQSASAIRTGSFCGPLSPLATLCRTHGAAKIVDR